MDRLIIGSEHNVHQILLQSTPLIGLCIQTIIIVLSTHYYPIANVINTVLLNTDMLISL